MQPKFSVVVVTYQRPAELRKALEALEKQENAPAYEVVVVDNDKQSSAQAIVTSFMARQPNWRYQTASQNNVSLARNAGAGLAQGEWLAFLDDDCIPRPNWLAMADLLTQSFPLPGLIMGGGYLPVASNGKQERDSMADLLPKDQYLLEGNLFFFRSEYIELGGMRPELGPSGARFGYHEGSDLQRRHLEKFGVLHRRVYEPKLAVRHLEANKKSKYLLAFLSGFDSVAAFPSPGHSKPKAILQYLKFPIPIFRLMVGYLNSNPMKRKQRCERELYRIGEIAAEVDLLLGDTFRALSNLLRRLNNRRVGSRRQSAKRPDLHRGNWPPGIPPQGTVGWMAGKIGTTELLALEFSDRWLRPPWPTTASWQRPMRRLFIDSGVFPPTYKQFQDFLETYKKALMDLNAICLWQTEPFLCHYEEVAVQALCPQAERVGLDFLSTEILGSIGRRHWLVVSPFTETMRSQVSRLSQVHTSRPWSAALADLQTRCEFLPCPTFSYLAPSPYQSWSEGLDRLTEEALRKKFEVALIGAGAWSLPLAARLKKAGKIAIHLGGETQLVFGIKGQRWEGYGIYNEHWVRPLPSETPTGYLKKEQGCYW